MESIFSEKLRKQNKMWICLFENVAGFNFSLKSNKNIHFDSKIKHLNLIQTEIISLLPIFGLTLEKGTKEREREKTHEIQITFYFDLKKVNSKNTNTFSSRKWHACLSS